MSKRAQTVSRAVLTPVYLEAADVARLCGVSAGFVRQEVKAGRIVPAAKTYRGVSLFDHAEVERYIAARDVRLEELASYRYGFKGMATLMQKRLARHRARAAQK